ncbi:sepiapterin reductase, partial [Malurus melanocephalus]|uniref:sepiapterin reductase n=1 Tax=Malurus melanocephalus TaxID=175006 RepID=UPI002548A71C
ACVVTGASRGFGRSLARLLAPRLGPGSALLLLARSAEPLAELATELSAGATTGSDTGSGGLRVQYVAADLGCEEGLRTASAAVRELLQDASFGRLLLVNNAGNDTVTPAGPVCAPRATALLPRGQPGHSRPVPAELGLDPGLGCRQITPKREGAAVISPWPGLIYLRN